MSNISPAPAPARAEEIEKVLDPRHLEVAQDVTADKYSSAEDDSADILRHAGYIEFDIQEDRKVLRKIDFWVLTPMMITYTLVHLDKNALSYGAVFDLQTATHLVGSQYSWLSSIIYLAQLVVQPISSFALVKLPLAKWVTINVFCWGVCCACMAACTNWAGLMVTRGLLGAFEATVSPTFIAVTQLWWRRREQTYRNTFWLMSSAIAGLFGPLLAFGVGHINDKIEPYQSIFIFLGCITVVLAPFLMWMMPDDIKSARFLNEREKAIAVERLRSNNTGTKTSKWKWDQVREAFVDPKTWMWGSMLMLLAIPSSGIGAFGDYFMQGGVLLTGSWVMNKFRLRFPVVASVTLMPIAGAIALIYVPRGNPRILLGPYYIVQLYSPIQPLLYAWANSNAAGTTKQRVVGGIMFICQCAGNVAGPQVYLAKEAPIYHTGLYVDVGCWCAVFVLVLLMGGYLKYLNLRQERRREAMGRIGRMVDTSIMTLEEAAEHNQRMAQDGEAVNRHAFDDKTDFENPDFIYVL
ncbi:hypothetical protein EHS25_005398 [Saitozyma podzolica]|uniref:Major facilitator superfamily (MFS) profile domain-containing protein n=1 Tax=Saitozyma podzolica TaxID=1890683 RepID=A0A427XY85_9TREE|nr:hypothetical protein EHS25_005398 [Saitozyma podzolica]